MINRNIYNKKKHFSDHNDKTSGFSISRSPAIRFLYKVEEISVEADFDRPYFLRLNTETYI